MAKELTPFPASAAILDKIESRHKVEWQEVQDVFRNHPRLFRFLSVDQYGEPRYYAWGQTTAGRYLTVVYVPVPPSRAKVITVRDMDASERRRFWRK